MGKLVLAAAMLAASVTAASGQWIYQAEESAFGDAGTQLAFTASDDGFGFGLRCTNGRPEAVYITKDSSFDAETYKIANATKPKLLVRIDSEPVITLEAELVDAEGNAVAVAEIEPSLIAAVRDAKKRVAVVLTLLGDNYHEKSFNVRGSTRALGKLAAACGDGAD